jgi:RNA polymerase sigma-70 factor (ECF subfamily)
MPDPQGEVTRLLNEVRGGHQEAMEQLLPLVYDELRRIAGGYFRRERTDHTLQPTALVHEAYMKLVDQRSVQWENRGHFLGVAATLMRRILLDYARTHRAEKRGGGVQKVELDEGMAVTELRAVEMIDLDRALTELASMDPDQGRIVELRFFGGLSVEETAEVMKISPATVKRYWASAKAWLYREIEKGNPSDSAEMEADTGHI